MAVLDYAGLQRYDGKIKTYTGNLVDTVVEVTDSEPSDQHNKIWIETSEEDVELAEMSDVDELKSALNTDTGILKNVVDNMSDALEIELTLSQNGYYWNVETSVAVLTELSSAYRASNPIAVSEGDIYTVSASVGTTHKSRIWILTDNDLNIVAMAQDFYTTAAITDTFIVPSGATKLLICTNSNLMPSPYASLYKKNTYKTAKENDVDNIVNNVFEDVRNRNFTLEQNYFWNVETEYAVYTPLSSNWMASSVIPVSEGEIYTITGDQGSTHKTRIWAVTDDDMFILAMAEDHYSTTETLATETFTVPSGGTKLVLCTRYNAGSPFAWLYKKTSALEMIAEPLSGKYLSLLGDSISAYAGTIPVGNDAYYTGANSGVTSPNQMWWKILCDKTGMIPLIINGYSGSGVTQLEDSDHVSKVPMSSDTRCAGLDDGTHNPDIILIAGGLNDYTYALSAQSEPLDWNGKTTPVLSNSFTEAYACMIKKIQTNYPNAIVIALSTWFTMRGTDNGYTLTHTVGSNTYTQQDYNDKIRFVAEQMHIPYIDVSNIGFNRNNMYPTYAIDSSTIPAHPNAAGQYEMGKAIAKRMVELSTLKTVV